MDILSDATKLLQDAGFATQPFDNPAGPGVVFEDATILGFVTVYDSGDAMLSSWAKDAAGVITKHQLSLRRSGIKAWNTYMVFLTADVAEPAALAAIEEDLTGTRKIARGSIRDAMDLRDALLPLLPLQTAPQLEAVDLSSEIRQRSSDVLQRAVEAFLARADANTILQALEDDQ
jgi:hypothetical protein